MGAGFAAHDNGSSSSIDSSSSTSPRSRNRAWDSASAGGSGGGGREGGEGRWRRDERAYYHSIKDGVLLSILKPPSDFETLEKAREPKETNIAGKKAKRQRSPRKISFFVSSSFDSGPVSYVKSFSKDEVLVRATTGWCLLVLVSFGLFCCLGVFFCKFRRH